jgi:alginate O-acetyltransferase complex protein AlgI
MLLGYRLDENFNAPYTATSMKDFWRRWEVGLVLWFQRYMNSLFSETRSENDDMNVFQMFTFAAIGIWHGTSYTFLMWGVFNGIIVLAESIVDYPSRIPVKGLRHLYTMFLVILGFVLFRSEDIYQASRYYLDLFGLNNNGFFSDIALRMIRENWIYYIFGILFCLPVARNTNEKMFKDPNSTLSQSMTVLYPMGMIALFAICLCFIVTGSYFPS